MIEKLLAVRPLSSDAEQYLFKEFCRYARATAPIGALTAIVLMCFEFNQHRVALMVEWLLPMILIQCLRYVVASRAMNATAAKYRYLFLSIEYIAVCWWVAYPVIFGWQTASAYDYLFRTFLVYIILVFYLSAMRYYLPSLINSALIKSGGVLLYLIFFTKLTADFKWSMALLDMFGFASLIYFGRMSHVLAYQTYALIEKNQDLIAKMDTMLIRDELTQQPNRRYFNAALTKFFKGNHEVFSLAMLDIDHFKDINDGYGHDIGDAVLVEVGAFLSNSIRSEDEFARYGGEEFVIILPQTSQAAATEVLEKLCTNFAENRFFVNDLEISLTISIGLTEVQETDNQITVIKRADNALYKAKNDGRNRVIAL